MMHTYECLIFIISCTFIIQMHNYFIHNANHTHSNKGIFTVIDYSWNSSLIFLSCTVVSVVGSVCRRTTPKTDMMRCTWRSGRRFNKQLRSCMSLERCWGNCQRVNRTNGAAAPTTTTAALVMQRRRRVLLVGISTIVVIILVGRSSIIIVIVGHVVPGSRILVGWSRNCNNWVWGHGHGDCCRSSSRISSR